jgi:hypothetical protein
LGNSSAYPFSVIDFLGFSYPFFSFSFNLGLFCFFFDVLYACSNIFYLSSIFAIFYFCWAHSLVHFNFWSIRMTGLFHSVRFFFKLSDLSLIFVACVMSIFRSLFYHVVMVGRLFLFVLSSIFVGSICILRLVLVD